MNVEAAKIMVNFDKEKVNEQQQKEVVAQNGYDAEDVKADPQFTATVNYIINLAHLS